MSEFVQKTLATSSALVTLTLPLMTISTALR